MTPLATPQDAVDLYGADYVITSADRDGDGALELAPFTRALAVATAEVLGYLVGRVALPLDLATYPQFRKLTIDCAIYHSCPTADVLTDEKKARYAAAIAYLEKVATGRVVLVLDSPAGPEPAPRVSSAETSPAQELYYQADTGARTFSRERLRRM